MNWFTMYLFTRVDPILSAVKVITIILGIGLAALGGLSIGYFSDREYNEEMSFAVGYFKKFAPWFILLVTILVLTPTQADIAKIVIVPKIVNNEQVADIPEKALNILHIKLDDYLEVSEGEEAK